MNALLFSMQYVHVSFSCMLQLETIRKAGKSLIVHIKATFIRKLCFVDTSSVKVSKDQNCIKLSINGRRQTSNSGLDY